MLVSIILFLCIGICTITDILRKTVDIRVLLAFSLILAVCCYFEKNYNIESFVAGIGIGILLACISILSRGAVGMGDVCLYSIIICFFVENVTYSRKLSGFTCLSFCITSK